MWVFSAQKEHGGGGSPPRWISGRHCPQSWAVWAAGKRGSDRGQPGSPQGEGASPVFKSLGKLNTTCCHQRAAVSVHSTMGAQRLKSCPTLDDPTDCSPQSSSVHGTLQTRILEWISMPSSRGIFPSRGSNPGLPHCKQILYHLWVGAIKSFPLSLP